MDDVPEMVERVAKALWVAQYTKNYDEREEGTADLWQSPDMPERYRREYLVLARAAIEAMREPTEAMLSRVEPALDALYNGVKEEPGYETGGKFVYRAMIDAALGKLND